MTTEIKQEQTADDVIHGFSLVLQHGQEFKFRPAKVREIRDIDNRKNLAHHCGSIIEFFDKAKALIAEYQTNPEETDFEELELDEVSWLLMGLTQQLSVDLSIKKNLE